MRKTIVSIIRKNRFLEPLWFHFSWADVHHSRLAFFLRSILKRPNLIEKKNLPMVLVGQIQRSGGTLMAQLFDNHPQIYCHPPEWYWGKPQKWNWPSFDVKDDFSIRNYYYLLYESWITDGSIHRVLDFGNKSNPNKYPFDFNVGIHRRTLFNLLQSKELNSRRDVLNCYLSAFYSAWLDYKNINGNKKYHFAFIPRISMHQDSVQRYFEDYPDGYFIHIFRNPSAWWASAKRHQNQYSEISALKLWESSTKNGIELKKKYNERVICINFEGLIKNTKETMRLICQHLDLHWDDVLVTPTFNSIPVASDSSFESNKIGVVSRSVEQRYKTMLDDEEILEINKKYTPFYLRANDYCINKI